MKSPRLSGSSGNALLLRIAATAARRLPRSFQRALYRLGPATGAIRALLTRAAPEGLQTVDVAGGDLRGARLTIDLKTEKDLWLGTYEPDLQAAIGAVVRSGMVAYDLGANVGYVSLLLARAVGPTGRVLAYEPSPANLERLRAHVADNPEGARIRILAKAAGGRRGRSRFLLHASGSMGRIATASERRAEFVGEVVVETVDLDGEVYREGYPPPDVVKIDIEGGEASAVRGMARLLHEARPVLLLEIHSREAGADVWRVLKKASYQVCRMAPGYPTLDPTTEKGRKAYLVALPQVVEAP